MVWRFYAHGEEFASFRCRAVLASIPIYIVDMLNADDPGPNLR